MSMVRKQDIPKAVALVLGIAAVFGFMVMRVLSISAVSPQPASTPPIVATAPKTLVASVDNDDSTLDLPTLISNGAEDPFRDVLPPVAVPTVPPVRQTIVPRRWTRRPSPRSIFTGMEQSYPVLPDARTGAQPMGVESMGVVSTEPEVRVTGVVPGEDAYAVVKVGDKDHVVRQGETVDGNVEIVHIGDTSVTVRQAGKTKTITVGG